MTIDVPLRLPSVDDYLGPAGGRFFGSGYRKADHRLRDAVIEPDGTARAVAAVRYPVDWSRKADADLRPHLSTIDVMVLAAELAGFQLRRAGLRSGRPWLRRVEIKAGLSAVEEALDGFDISAGVPVGDASALPPRRHRSEVAARIANMRLRLTFEHPPLGPPGPAALPERPGWHGFRLHRQRITDVAVDTATAGAEAAVTLEAERGVTLIDSFVVALQLGQILLYELDGLTRASSNTLWMRATTLEAPASPSFASRPFRAVAALEDRRLVEARGGIWRTATITGDCLGVRTHCAVAHELPAAK